MAQRQSVAAEEIAIPDEATLLRHARERLAEGHTLVELNGRQVWLKYGADVDLLTIRFKEKPRPTRTTDDLDAGVIYNFEGDQIVSVEILDITGIFVEEEDA